MTDLKPLIDFFEKEIPLSEEEKEFIYQELSVREFPKKTEILEIGDVSKEFYFVLDGIVRMYYVSDGEELTTFFYSKGEFVSSYKSYLRQIPCEHSFQCITDCKLVVIGAESAQKLLQFSKKFESLARIMMEVELVVYQDIISSFITLSPEQRYLKLIEEKKDLVQQIPQKHLASFIGVRPESYSRIRKRIVSR